MSSMVLLPGGSFSKCTCMASSLLSCCVQENEVALLNLERTLYCWLGNLTNVTQRTRGGRLADAYIASCAVQCSAV